MKSYFATSSYCSSKPSCSSNAKLVIFAFVLYKSKSSALQLLFFEVTRLVLYSLNCDSGVRGVHLFLLHNKSRVFNRCMFCGGKIKAVLDKASP